MDLAQGNGRQLGILSLPDEILDKILNCFSDELYHYEDGALPFYGSFSSEDDDFRAIQNARLVCRRFCDVASPRLVPVLNAYISSESLTRVDSLTRNPLIAAGVRLVQLVLEYRPKEVAQDWDLYKGLQYEKISELMRQCDWLTEFHDPEWMSDEERKVLDAYDVYTKITLAWDACHGPQETKSSSQPDADGVMFQELLCRGFNEYRQKHEDQYRLLTTGRFAGSLADSISRMTRLQALSAFDHLHKPLDDFFGMSAVTILANDFHKLHEIMVSPQDWETIEKMRPIPELLSAKLLWELPIALTESGKELREFSIASLPLHSNFDMLCPHVQSGDQPAWDRLQAAFRWIRKVQVGRSGGNMSHKSIRTHHLPDEQHACIDRYFSALLSGTFLDLVEIDLYPLQLHDGNRNSEINAKDRLYRLSSVMASVCCSHLRTLDLSHISLRQDELERLFSRLGSGLKKVYLYDVGVLDGGWERPLCLLREKILAGRSSRRFSVTLKLLRGGAFDLVSSYDSDIDDISTAPSVWDKSTEDDGEGGMLCCEAEKYVLGVEGIVNPVAELETRLTSN